MRGRANPPFSSLIEVNGMEEISTTHLKLPIMYPDLVADITDVV